MCGASGVGHSPTPDRPSLGRAGGARYPLALKAGGVGVGTRHQSHDARSCKLALRAVEAARGRPGGALLAWVWGVRGWMLSHGPRLSLTRAAGAHYQLAVGVGSLGMGTCHQPHSARSCELTVRAVGGTRGRSGAAPPSCVWGVRGWALSHAQPPVLGASGQGPLPTGGGCGAVGVGTHHQPHSARSWKLTLRAVEAAQGRPGGGASCLRVGRPGLGANQRPTARPLGVRPGPTTHWL